MKAEDVARIYNESGRLEADMEWGELTWVWRRALIAFARACEQHGIERSKAGAEGRIVRSAHGHSGPGVELDWSALDAEVEKENKG